MHFKGLDLNLLVALDALLAEKNTTRAGERLYLSQSATSGALARLREFFHDELLLQVGHKMVLTPLAESLLEPVRHLLLEADAIANRTHTFHPETCTRRFRVMLSDYAAQVVMVEAVRRLQHVAPRVAVEMLFTAETPAAHLERGDVDLLIMPEGLTSEEHPREELFRDDFTCVVWAENPLVGDTVTLEQYLELGHVAVRFGNYQAVGVEEQWLEHHGYRRRVEVVALTFGLLPQLLVGTRRIATMHRRLAVLSAAYLPLRLIPPPVSLPILTESLQWHRSLGPDPANRWLRAFIKSSISNPAGG